MRIIIEDNYNDMSKQAALLVASQVRLLPDTVLGLATGSTPLGMYKSLVDMYQADEIDFSQVKTFNLDEYFPISPENPQSYHYYMKTNFFNQINIKEKNYHLLDGTAERVKDECQRYDNMINKAGGIDLQVLGIGANGHIGFNEPDDRLNVTTHLVKLKEETIERNSRFFENKEQVPQKALTVGISTILKAKKIILLASGKEKAKAIKNTVNNYVTTRVPSSLLQTHPDITLVIDQQAASLL
ncbi:MAG: glucosamine-6-phosphate deaminase [Bacillota bacterium]